jgi:hypothetical protein
MAKTEIAKASDTAVSRPRDIFSTMRHEMDRMFERFDPNRRGITLVVIERSGRFT